MAQITRLGLYGGARSLYGSFVKPTATKSFVKLFTRHALYGGARQPYGSFAGKVVAGKTGGPFTRHALYGGARPLYGSFAGKTPAPPVTRVKVLRRTISMNVLGMMGRRR